MEKEPTLRASEWKVEAQEHMLAKRVKKGDRLDIGEEYFSTGDKASGSENQVMRHLLCIICAMGYP